MNHFRHYGKSRLQIHWGTAKESGISQAVRLKQTHSDITRILTDDESVLKSPHGFGFSLETHDPTKVGDGLLTNLPNVRLGISTADCLPVMMFQPETGWIGAIHAGWKGVAQKIVAKAVDLLFQTSRSRSPIDLWIGPHIQSSSFEVGEDVASEILNSLSLDSARKDCVIAGPELQQTAPGKKWVSLSQVVLCQLQEANVPLGESWISPVDTKTCSLFHSHRRDRENSGRNISWIQLRELS